MEEKIKTEFEQGFDRGYQDGFRAGRYDKFISPLKRCIFIGLLIAAAIIFGLFALGFLISTLFIDVISGIIGAIICGLITGASTGTALYLIQDLSI